MVCLFPGLIGCGKDPYARSIVQEAVDKDYNVCVVNHRSELDTPVTSPTLYGFGSSQDVKEAISYIHTHYKPSKLFAVGFSLGANNLGKYQGEQGSKT